MHWKKTFTRKNQPQYTNNYIKKKSTIQEILSYVKELKRQRAINKVRRKKLQQEIYRNIQKKKKKIKLIMK